MVHYITLVGLEVTKVHSSASRTLGLKASDNPVWGVYCSLKSQSSVDGFMTYADIAPALGQLCREIWIAESKKGIVGPARKGEQKEVGALHGFL